MPACPHQCSPDCHDTRLKRANDPIVVGECDDHRLETFQTICRACGSRDVSYARRAAYKGRPLSAICGQCGAWEIIK